MISVDIVMDMELNLIETYTSSVWCSRLEKLI